MEKLSFIELRKSWRRYVANAGSMPDAQCYKDNMHEICQSLATAFAPRNDEDMISPSRYRGDDVLDKRIDRNRNEEGNNSQPPNSQPTNLDLSTRSHSMATTQAMNEQAVPDQIAEKEDVEMKGTEIQESSSLNISEEGAETQITETQDADEQRTSDSDQSNGNIDETPVIVTEPIKDVEKLVEPVSGSTPAAQSVAVIEEPSLSPTIEGIGPPFHSIPLKPTSAEIRALYLHLLYHDRFILLNSPGFLLFLSQQPQLSQDFLRYLIDNRFGIRYIHRDGSNANHGITPFVFPFLPVRRDLALSLYFDNRWALLNDPSWLEWVSTEEFIKASFWSEMSFRGGLGAMQRRKEVTERPSKFEMSPF